MQFILLNHCDTETFLKILQCHETVRAQGLLQGWAHLCESSVLGESGHMLISRKSLPVPHNHSLPYMPVSVKKWQPASQTDFRGWRRMILGPKLIIQSAEGDEKVAGDGENEMLQREQGEMALW